MHTSLRLERPLSGLSPDGPYGTRTITTLKDLTRLEAPWRSLGEDRGGPIEQFDWAMSCAVSGRVGTDLQVIAATRGDRLVAVAPLALKRLYGVRRRMLLGVDELHEPMDLLASDPEALAQLAESLARSRQPVIFERLVADSASVQALRNEFGKRGLALVRPQTSYPYIPLDKSWSDPDQHLNSGRRSDLRRARRRAEKLGSLTVEVLSPRLEKLDALLDEAFAVEALSWKGRQGTALACDTARAAFYRRYASAACQQGILRLCFLRIDGRAVATQIAVVKGGSFWLLKIGYDAQFAQCSPGILLMRESIAYAARAGLRSFEFLGQTEPWIEVWTRHKRGCVSLRVYPYSLRGAAALAADTTVKLGGIAGQTTRRGAMGLRWVAKACLMPLVKRAARKYIAGNTLDDAIRAKELLAAGGLSATIGFWDTDKDSARAVADQYLAGLDALAGDDRQAYLSIKLPSLRFSSELLREVVERARAKKRRIHFDALAPDTADRTRAMIEEVLAKAPGVDLGCTLPGRWKRSLEDARWAAERGLFVRVVKGQWPDPDDPRRDMTAGYLEVIDQLAGRARRVGVATHDPVLAAEAVRRLQAAGTPCELELLYGLPMRKSIAMARELGIGVRVYVPYGEAYMPYALSHVRRNPRIVWWLVKDLIAS